MIQNKKILITGGKGFIGSWLVEKFALLNKITTLDNGRRDGFKFLPEKIRSKVEQVEGDILDKELVSKLVKNKDIIIHLAAIAGASFYEKDPLTTIRVNLLGTVSLLEALEDKNPEIILDFSSSEVYGPLAINVTEEDNTVIGPVSQSRWSYAVSKLASEHLGHAYHKVKGLPITSIRPFNVYGPRQVGEGAVANMIQGALKDKQITVTGDGSQKRPWIYIEDFIEAIELIIDQKKVGKTFNIGNPDTYITISKLAELISKLEPNTKIIYTDKVKAEIQERLPNIDLLKSETGFYPKTKIEPGLKQTFDWYKQNLGNF